MAVVKRFSAVTTTGIYCRPGCPARPHPENVQSFHTAAAAEAAGYRACHRCRPYRLDPPIVCASSELVCRAVRLIAIGALDDGSEQELGARLGISARHLRRLFGENLGVTPDQLARSRRVHFARRLLDDTDLSIADVAYASGFGSVRQFNRACQDVFRCSPRELRARRRSTDRLVADGGLVLRLPFEPPLEWDLILPYLAGRAIPGVESVAGGTYRRTVEIDGDPGVLEVSCVAPDHLLLRCHLPHWEGLFHLTERVRRNFNLDADVGAARRHLEHDGSLGPLIRERPGIRPVGAWDGFEVGVRAITGQGISVRAATTITGRLAARYGAPVAGLAALGLTHTFPPPSVLATADLRGLGLTQQRQRAISGFAAAVMERTLLLDGSQRLDQLVENLAALPGIGDWTAHYIALRLGEPDAFPTADLGLRRSLECLLGEPLDPGTAERLADTWRPWRAFAAAHLWLTSERLPIPGGVDRADSRPLSNHADTAA
jgi:AraC family transcriptional regulator of adaptative response / DNA-3-methyladenine glycosylase II